MPQDELPRPVHRVRGVDHAAFPTFDPGATVRFYRDVLKFPVVHSICAAGWGPERHPDFIHFFFDIGNDDRLAFFYYFGWTPAGDQSAPGDAWARLPHDTPDFFKNSRHIALNVADEEDLMEYRRRLDESDWPVEMQVMHETIESIYTHDPNGYMLEITRQLRPVTPQEDLDAQLTIDALCDVTAGDAPSMDALLTRKAELIVERAEAWAATQPGWHPSQRELV
ncbi:VOC family protein [Nocardioides kongjuensis]|uniref:Catechol 2,3-dioxygenase-like lactoylglutathione lyase family enzyme n=1 Tax=Nocardioides kongjuensis TaxID=349522 RepID=A0A852RZF7_9ACTN|nr:VOC family protein [Nocardioides kongjuensis]NYD33204.1 catechol 2,3-dioxygenase-like lactoylglutathione lyase family enzyme [Nocardioides kongjuensis]